jgi:hypothetical protein
MVTPQAAPSGGGGGGKKPKKPKKPIISDPGHIPPGGGKTTPDIMGDTWDNMMDWRPISSDGNGGTQPMNPTVDPRHWLHGVDPKYQETRDMGIYVNPAIAQQQAMAQQGMLAQSAMPTHTTSTNPYSLLG